MPTISSAVPTSNGPRICAANASALPASAARCGWARLLWLEHFGLDVQRDQIQFQVIGDQTIQMQAMETGIIDAAALDGVFSRRLKQKGFSIIGEYPDLNATVRKPSPSGTAKNSSNSAPDTVENLLKAEIEAIALLSRAEKQIH